MVILGLPVVEWIVMPLLGLAYGAMFYRDLAALVIAWGAAAAFLLARFLIEADAELGRPDRLAAVLVMWTLYALAMAAGATAVRMWAVRHQ